MATNSVTAGGSSMEIKHDQKENPYIDVGNIRVTFVMRKSRDSSKDWSESHVLRVQAYRDPGHKVSQALHQGAEFPVNNHKEACALLAAISHLVSERMP